MEGHVTRAAALRAAVLLSALVAVLLTLLPVAAAPTGALMLFLAYAYSGPPFALNRRGLGELTVIAVVNILVPVFGAQLQGGVRSPLLYVLAPLAIVQFLRMLVLNMADLEPDRAAGKRTLVVRSVTARTLAAWLYVRLGNERAPLFASHLNGLCMTIALAGLLVAYPLSGIRLVMLYPLLPLLALMSAAFAGSRKHETSWSAR